MPAPGPSARSYRKHGLFRRFQRRASGSMATEKELRQAEVDLLRQQVKLGYANVFAAIVLSIALVTITTLQLLSAESTARIERAKAQPHFRIKQENQHDELGFMPRRFSVEADAGVSDATEARAVSVMRIQFYSLDLGLRGECRAAFPNFYGWTNDAISFELNDAAERLLNFSRTPDLVSESYIRLRPLWVTLEVSFIDLFGSPGQQDLLVSAGTTRRLTAGELESRSRANLALHLQTDERGMVVVHQLPGIPESAACRDAVRVMSRLPWLRLARPDEPPQDTAIPFVTAS